MKRKVLPAIIVLLAAAGGAALWYDLPVRLGWISAPDAAHLTLYGNVDIRQVQLGFRIGGRLTEALVEEGDAVTTGDLLARLDSRPLADAVRAAGAQVEAMDAALDKLETGPRSAEIARARATHAERLAELRNAEQALERAVKLQSRGAVPDAGFDQALATRNMAVTRTASALEALHLLEQGSCEEDIAAARANLQAAEANPVHFGGEARCELRDSAQPCRTVSGKIPAA